jgi:hypothetical protein
MTKGSGIPGGVALVTVTLTLVLLPAGAPAAVHVQHRQAGALLPVHFGLPAAKEGKTYRFSIAGAATGGVKPYHCAPESLDEGSLQLGSNCVISGKAPELPASTTRRVKGPFVFKLTDSGSPPKTVTLYPLNLTILASSPFDGTWKVTQSAGRITVSCSGDTSPTVVPFPAYTSEESVVNDRLRGHALAVSASGSTATVDVHTAASGFTLDEHFVFSSGGSLHGAWKAAGTSAGGCQLGGGSTLSGSRISK